MKADHPATDIIRCLGDPPPRMSRHILYRIPGGSIVELEIKIDPAEGCDLTALRG